MSRNTFSYSSSPSAPYNLYRSVPQPGAASGSLAHVGSSVGYVAVRLVQSYRVPHDDTPVQRRPPTGRPSRARTLAQVLQVVISQAGQMARTHLRYCRRWRQRASIDGLNPPPDG